MCAETRGIGTGEFSSLPELKCPAKSKHNRLASSEEAIVWDLYLDQLHRTEENMSSCSNGQPHRIKFYDAAISFDIKRNNG
jgi:hypothetical protein